jgi:hypothetical protein
MLSPAGEAPPLRAYLDVVRALQTRKVVEVFQQNQIDVRRVLALLAQAENATSDQAADELLPLAVFHLQETSPLLRERAAGLLRTALERTDIAVRMSDLPDSVLEYLKTNFTEGHPLREAAGHWIEAELSRRTNAYKLEALLKPTPRPRGASPRVVENPVTQAEAALAAPPPPPADVASRTPRLPKRRPSVAAPPPPPPPPPTVDGAEAPAAQPDMNAILGELALPTAAPKRPDTAVWLWVAIVVILVLMCVVVVGALAWIQAMQG